MEALILFSRYAPNRTFVAVIFGALSGLFYAFLIPIVMQSLESETGSFVVKQEVVRYLGLEVSHSRYAALFLMLCALILVFKTISEILLSRISLDIRFRLRKDLYRHIQKAPIASLERIGEPRLLQALSGDVSAIVMGAQLFPQIISSGVVIFGMLGYLAFLDFEAFLYVIGIIVFGIVTYQIPVFFGIACFRKAREHQDRLQEAFKGLVEGAKELKLDAVKRAEYERRVLYREEHATRSLEKRGMTIFSAANNYGGLMSFFAIGGLAFVYLNYHAISNAKITAAVMVLLYVTGPMAVLLNFTPQIARTRIALRKIKKLYGDLPDENIPDAVAPIREWATYALQGIRYRHQGGADVNGREFEVGPIDLEIHRGEILFITGGNGSGKSTLMKLVSQHYRPDAGDVCLDGVRLDNDAVDAFRNGIACIYSDYYLFDRLLHPDRDDPAYLAQVRHYLDAFALADKVKVEDGRFTTLKLSDGQRRRLALVVAIAENKAMYVFDEWAADQDPQFKNVFYREVLPILKARNNAVVVISHDDRFFDAADRVVRMETGRIVS